ncbi:TldD/PmbA family protein [Phenylobacterium sp.]|jgi:PmbA protein|uniref:TldD/PmbA family protein n=1 Tax=Phenylobacterium sp. TaxID=1871053 RepID=UPI002F3E6D3B
MDDVLLNDLVAAALKAGADAAEAVGAERRALSITVRLGELEEVEREESRDLGLRVFVGRRQASVSGSDVSPDARAKLVERVVAMARLAPEDPYAGLADPQMLARGPLPDLDLYDPTEPTPEHLEADARTAEDAARATPGVVNSDGASASWSSTQWRLVTSGGFSGLHRASGFSISASAIAGDGQVMESGSDWRSVRWRSDLPAAEAIGAEAGRRAANRLGARKIASTTAPVIFENRLAASLLGPLIGAISGPSIARGTSFLKDKLDKPVFAPGVTVSDDPHRKRGLGSAPFDDEGVANRPRNLIDKGVLTTWLLNSAAGRQLGLPSTGHASRGLAGPPGVSPANLTMQPGTADRAALMRDAGAGLLITSMFGPSLNGNTGDWSVGCSGFWFEGGEPAYPVNEITVAGNLIDIYARLVPGADLEFRGGANAPSLLVDALAIAGL